MGHTTTDGIFMALCCESQAEARFKDHTNFEKYCMWSRYTAALLSGDGFGPIPPSQLSVGESGVHLTCASCGDAQPLSILRDG